MIGPNLAGSLFITCVHFLLLYVSIIFVDHLV